MSWAESNGRNREIAALGADAVAEVAALIGRVGVGRQFDRVEHEAGVVGIGLEAHVVEDEKFGFRAEEGGVADAGGLQEGFGLLGDAAGIAVIGLAGHGLEHVADDGERCGGEEGVDGGGGRIGHQHHVGFVDRLPAGDRRAVEHCAFREHFLIDEGDVEGHVLPFAARIGKTKIDILDVFVLDSFQNVFGSRHFRASCR